MNNQLIEGDIMRKTVLLLSTIFFLIGSVNLMAKCYTFSNGGEYQACVKGDSFADRKVAKDNCSKAKGSDCGNVSSYSSSCHSNSGKCVDENGKLSRSLSGY